MFYHWINRNSSIQLALKTSYNFKMSKEWFEKISNLTPCYGTFFILEFASQVLPLIFKQLSVNDRKIVKLVCRSWLYICNQPSLINDEVINCSRSDSLYDIYEYLDKSSHKLLNLKFDKLYFYNYDDLTFWKNNGHRIRSIIFKNCDMDRSILEKIIMFCPNSLHLVIIMNTYHSGFEK